MRRTGSHIKKHDVGDGRKLTTRQIANEIGGTPHNVRARLAKGWTGAQLLIPIFERRRKGVARTPTQVVAYKLALKFGHNIPTVQQIRDTHPMDTSTARYWRNAVIAAQETL